MRTPRNSVVADYFESAASYWNDIYRNTDVYSVIHQERRSVIQNMVAQLGLPTGARVLEVGCGAGHLAIELAHCGYRVEAVDRSESMVSTTLANARAAGVADRIESRQLDIYTLDYAPRTFDLVLAIGVLPWLKAMERSVQALARVAAPGGHVITTIDHRWGWHRVLDIRTNPAILGVKRLTRVALEKTGIRQPLARHRTHSIRKLDRALAAAGLEKQIGLTLGFGPFTFWNRNLLSDEAGVEWHRRLQNSAEQGHPLLRSGGAQYVVLAKKCVGQKKDLTARRSDATRNESNS